MFVRLTKINRVFNPQELKLENTYTICYVVVENICQMLIKEEGTEIYFFKGEGWIIVKETPEEIVRLIKEAENE